MKCSGRKDLLHKFTGDPIYVINVKRGRSRLGLGNFGRNCATTIVNHVSDYEICAISAKSGGNNAEVQREKGLAA